MNLGISALNYVNAIKNNEFTVEEFVSESLERINHVDEKLHAFLLVNDLALKKAKEIVFSEYDKKEKELIYPIKRKNFSRAELKGILRELHDSKSNYDLAYMAEDDFLNNVFAVQDGNKDEFIMKIYKELGLKQN